MTATSRPAASIISVTATVPKTSSAVWDPKSRKTVRYAAAPSAHRTSADSAVTGDSARSSRRNRKAAVIRMALKPKMPMLPIRGTWKPMSAQISVAASGEMTTTPASTSHVRWRSSALTARRRWETSRTVTTAEKSRSPVRKGTLQSHENARRRMTGENSAAAGRNARTPKTAYAARSTQRSWRDCPRKASMNWKASAVPSGDATMSIRCHSTDPDRCQAS